jgi:hypothetical protein
MGDRISIRFVDEHGNKSATLFSHWGGKDFLNTINTYLDELYYDSAVNNVLSPLGRKEPETVMVDFIRWLTKTEERIYGNYYIVPTPNDGDNSDNGHYDVILSISGYEIKKIE